MENIDDNGSGNSVRSRISDVTCLSLISPKDHWAPPMTRMLLIGVALVLLGLGCPVNNADMLVKAPVVQAPPAWS
jgi:hypothetical protein